jgi:hypothetical protein
VHVSARDDLRDALRARLRIRARAEGGGGGTQPSG